MPCLPLQQKRQNDEEEEEEEEEGVTERINNSQFRNPYAKIPSVSTNQHKC
jgi:hypothetical protein